MKSEDTVDIMGDDLASSATLHLQERWTSAGCYSHCSRVLREMVASKAPSFYSGPGSEAADQEGAARALRALDTGARARRKKGKGLGFRI